MVGAHRWGKWIALLRHIDRQAGETASMFERAGDAAGLPHTLSGGIPPAAWQAARTCREIPAGCNGLHQRMRHQERDQDASQCCAPDSQQISPTIEVNFIRRP